MRSTTYSRLALQNVCCPFCLCLGGSELYRVTAREAASHFVQPYGRTADCHKVLQSIIEQLWKQSICRVVECASCRGVFAFPFVGGGSSFYGAAYPDQKSDSYPDSRWEYAESLRIAAESGRDVRSAGTSVLEIGAGKGAFTPMLLERGVSPARITVTEHSQYGKQAIRGRFPGVHVFDGDDLTSFSDHSFSHIFLFQVLEHLGNPHEFLLKLGRLLKANGIVFASVPSPESIEFNELNRLLLDMPPNHISRYTRKAMDSLCFRAGLVLERQVYEPFDLGSSLRLYLSYRYLRSAQQQPSIPAAIERWLSGKTRKVAAALYASAFTSQALITLLRKRPRHCQLFVLRPLEHESVHPQH